MSFHYWKIYSGPSGCRPGSCLRRDLNLNTGKSDFLNIATSSELWKPRVRSAPHWMVCPRTLRTGHVQNSSGKPDCIHEIAAAGLCIFMHNGVVAHVSEPKERAAGGSRPRESECRARVGRGIPGGGRMPRLCRSRAHRPVEKIAWESLIADQLRVSRDA